MQPQTSGSPIKLRLADMLHQYQDWTSHVSNAVDNGIELGILLVVHLTLLGRGHRRVLHGGGLDKHGEIFQLYFYYFRRSEHSHCTGI